MSSWPASVCREGNSCPGPFTVSDRDTKTETTCPAAPGMEPAGSLGAVTHQMQRGELVTRASFTAVRQPADIWRYMNSSTRKGILRVLSDQGSAG